MTGLLKTYRTLAWIVGTLIIVLYVAVALKYLATDGTDAQRLGSDVTAVVGFAHGWIYIAYLVVVAIITGRVRWSVTFTVVTLLVGLIPIATFWAEHRATKAVRAKFPETDPKARQAV